MAVHRNVGKKKRPFRAPRGALVEAADGRWRIEIDDIADLDKKLGREVVEALVRCLVFSDRVSALAHFIHLCDGFDQAGAIWQRNVATAHYLTTGLLRELSHATKALRSALFKRGWYDKADAKMVELRRFEKQWDADRRLIDIRDKAAFHLSPDVLTAGIESRSALDRPLVILQGDGTKYFQIYSALAHDVVFAGLGFSEQDQEFFMQSTSQDLSIAVLLKDLCSDLLDRAHIPLKREAWTE